MQLPSGVKAYFEADKGDDADALAQVFSGEAVVEDEGARHEGVDAIRATIEFLFMVENGAIVALRIG
jgi:hypothetical protein